MNIVTGDIRLQYNQMLFYRLFYSSLLRTIFVRFQDLDLASNAKYLNDTQNISM